MRNQPGSTMWAELIHLQKLTQLLLVSPNFYSNKFWILDKNKVLIKFKQAFSYSWNNKNKTYKLIPYAVVRREEKKYKSCDIPHRKRASRARAL